MEKIVHAFRDDVLADHDGVALAELIARGEISAAEVVEAAIARAERVAPPLNAIAAERFAQARSEAERLPGGRFAGVPTFIKDNTNFTGLTTNHGSAAVRSQPAAKMGVYAEQYMAQGFICLGKSSLPEFGLSATTEFADGGATHNPWHTDYSCGASSGGSAAMVAAGVVPIAHANDGGGSIRIPAACCGLIGLKPSRGRHVTPEAAQSLPINIISEGVVTRSVRDTATFHAEAEKYYRNPKLPPLGLVEGPGARRLRIGVVVDSGHRTPHRRADAPRRRAYRRASGRPRPPRRDGTASRPRSLRRRLSAVLGPPRLRSPFGR
jgi:amidase